MSRELVAFPSQDVYQRVMNATRWAELLRSSTSPGTDGDYRDPVAIERVRVKVTGSANGTTGMYPGVYSIPTTLSTATGSGATLTNVSWADSTVCWVVPPAPGSTLTSGTYYEGEALNAWTDGKDVVLVSPGGAGFPSPYPVVDSVCPVYVTAIRLTTNVTGGEQWMIEVDATSGNRIWTLPTRVAGMSFCVVKVDSSSNTVTVACQAGDTISGATTRVITSQWTAIDIDTGTAGWIVH